MRVKRLAVAGLAAALASTAVAAAAADKPITERNETVQSAVATPVEDLNIKKTKIPEILLRAQANPYDPAAASTCEAIAVEVAAINEELGDDYDDLAVKQDAGGSKGPKPAALLKAGVAQAIPFRGLVRQISGAAQHEKTVEQAIDAGFARRGFLKGRALQMNCAPPAAPAWFTPAPEKTAALTAPAPQTAPAPAPEAATTAPVGPAMPSSRPVVEAAPLPLIPGASEGLAPAPEAAPPAADPMVAPPVAQP